MRHSYWSCSKFASWIRRKFGNFDKPNCATSEQWSEWRDNSKTNHPNIYWFTEEFLNKAQNFIYWPYDRYCDVRHYLYNGFVTKPHYLKTGFKFGRYYEIDDRMLYGMFETLVDFIEIEKAHMGSWNHPEYKSINPWWKEWRCPEAGLAHLDWEISLEKPQKDEDGKEIPFSDSPRQAESAKEQLALYNWWKYTRPNRPDPYKVIHGKGNKKYDKIIQMEDEYRREDEEMLIRLVKIREHLWT